MWEKLYDEAKKVLNGREISPFIYGGQVASAILTSNGQIYTGVCIEGTCGLNVCAERNAIFNMITHGENQVVKVVTVDYNNELRTPCGICREMMMQLDKEAGEIEILTELESKKVVKLKELIPIWWGKERFEEVLK